MDRFKEIAGRAWVRYRGFPMWAQIVIGIVVVSVVVGPFLGDDDKKTEEVATSEVVDETATSTAERSTSTTRASSTTEKPTTTTKPLSPQEALQEKVSGELGKSNRDDVTRVSVAYEDGFVLVTWAINESLTDGLTKDNARQEAVQILKTIRESKVEFSEVMLEGTYSLVDQYGNASEKQVVLAHYLASTVNRINFDNFNYKNVFEITDESRYVHPAFVY